MVRPDPTSNDAIALSLLVLRCQAGDERAFASLYERFNQRTLAYLRGLIGDVAEDANQELWIGVFRTVRTLANPRAFRTWLFTATRHRALDHLRRQKRERELFGADSDLDAVAEVIGAPAPEEDRGHLSDSDLRRVMTDLPPPQREVLLLRYQDDLSYTEIAVVVGCSIGTVRSRLHHAKLKLARLLEHEVSTA
jgi:RNA polymerase sigma-70 factor (ECF subfamily)